MTEKAFLDPKVIKDKLFEKKVLRAVPGLKDDDVPLDLADISGSPESIHLVIDFITSLDDPGFDSKKSKMPEALAKAVIKMLAKELRPKSGRQSLGTIVQGLSFQLDMTYKEIYDLMGINAEDVVKLQKLIVVDTSDENIDESLEALKKFTQALHLDVVEMQRTIYVSFAGLYPSPISLKSADDPGYEADHVSPEAVAIAQRVIDKLSP